MDQVISIGYGEIALKKGNRGFFVKLLRERIKEALKQYEDSIHLYEDRSKFYIEANEEDASGIRDCLKKIFGIVTINVAYRVDKDMDVIGEAAAQIMKQKKEMGKSFKVETKRADKNFPLLSPEISRQIGDRILREGLDFKVDLHEPDIYLNIEIRNQAYLWFTKERGAGGLPVGCNGRAMLLLSGGIDSPVAGYMTAKRGVKLSAVHFHSYPFTSERAEEKVLALAQKISPYTGVMSVYSINLLEIQKQIHAHCPEAQMTLLSRRMMMRLGEKVSQLEQCHALITGESLGQVASQTIQSLDITNSVVDMPVFRPLIGMDKTEIMERAHEIGTYETSILPYEDCCTVFLPKHPLTKPKRGAIEVAEQALDMPGLLEKALSTLRLYRVNPHQIKEVAHFQREV